MSTAVASIFVPVLVFTLFYFTSEVFLPDFVGRLFGIVIIILIFIGFPVLFVLANDYFKQVGKLKKDIELGLVYCFEGVPDQKDSFFKKIRMSPEEDSKKQIFEILSGSGFLFSLNGSLVKSRCEIKITEAVSAPENPYVLSLPKDFLQENSEQNAKLLRRRLTPAEIKELETHVKQLRRLSKPAFAFIIFFPFVAFFGAAASSASFAEWLDEFKFPLAIWLSFWLLTLYFYIRRVRYARKFSGDIGLGWVIIFRKQEEQIGENQQEILPVSSALWTDKGKPCEWRMLKNE